MATPNVGILTTAGKALIDKVNSGQAKISFSKIVFSSMDNSQLSDTQIKALTAIAPQEVVVSSPETTLDTNSGETRIRATGTNEKLADGVYVKTYGVFAKDDTGNEILYGVTVSPNPNYFPAYDGVTPQAVTYSYKTVIQETSNITMTNSNDVYVSQEDLTEAIAKIPQPDLSGYDKTNDVDKKLQNKQDKLGYTAANDNTVLHNNGLNQINTDDSGIIIGNDKDFGLIKRQGHKGGLATGFGNYFHFMTTDDSTLSNTSSYHDVWTISNDGKISILGGASFTPADDSKVVHTTGNEEIAGTKTFDTAPIDKATGNPYITKDGVPSTLADTTKPANFTAGLQSGGIDVATAADIKSIKDSAWREVTNSAFKGSYLFHDNQDGTVSITGTIYFPKPTRQYKGLDAYAIPLPDGYKATNVSSDGQTIGFINDYSITAEPLNVYFDGNTLLLYSALKENRAMSIPLCSIVMSELGLITSSPIVLKNN